jgi:hypothetical protein
MPAELLTIQYKNNLSVVSMGIIDAASNKKIVIDDHIDFASSKGLMLVKNVLLLSMSSLYYSSKLGKKLQSKASALRQESRVLNPKVRNRRGWSLDCRPYFFILFIR